MRRVLLILTLSVLLLPSANMITTDDFVGWEVTYMGHNLNNIPIVNYPNGNLAGYSNQKSYFFNSSLIYDADRVYANQLYYKYNETVNLYFEDLGNSVFAQAFYNPIKNDTYLVGEDFTVWKYNDTFYINQTWFDGSKWEGMGVTWFNLTNIPNDYFYSPITRSGIKFVYDYQNNFIMFFGGLTGSTKYHADTWIFDINMGEWRQILPMYQPGVRAFYGLTYNELDGKIYMSSGRNNFYFDDLWVYDHSSASWTEIQTNNSPGERSHHGMIYDSYNNKLLIYRGSGMTDLWAYDFKSKYWTFLSADTGPPISYDSCNDWIMYDNSSIVISGDYFWKLNLEMNSPPPGTEIIVTHTETVTKATTSTDYTTITDQKTEINYEDVTRYQNITSLFDGTTDETPFYTLGVFSVILVAIIIKSKRSRFNLMLR